jgi:LPXTG-motif cell wall-anchored protein
VLGNDSDVDGVSLSVSITVASGHGTVVVNANGTITYTPAPNYNGPDSFTYEISDGQGGTDTAAVAITITAVSDPLTSSNVNTVTTVATPVSGTIIVTDPDGSHHFSITTPPTNGVLEVHSDGTWTYTPNPRYVGTDIMSVSINRGGVDNPDLTGSITMTITVTVEAQAPSSGNGSNLGGVTKTGETASNYQEVLGMALVICGFILVVLLKRKRKEN